uniref:Uncharacterized protein n=1 Tax=Rhipicephalus appendiculatus TaxID=34631 RepID=A0A131YDZ7_RHIAP
MLLVERWGTTPIGTSPCSVTTSTGALKFRKWITWKCDEKTKKSTSSAALKDTVIKENAQFTASARVCGAIFFLLVCPSSKLRAPVPPNSRITVR